MAFISPNLSLRVWNSSADVYDHSQLADNFLKLDLHDHSPGKGVKIGTAAIEDAAITSEKLAPDAVVDINLTAGQIGEDKLVGGALLPLGIVMDWYPPLDAVPPISAPNGWAICDGSAWSLIPNDLGYTTGNIPDLRNAFTMGADATKARNTSSTFGDGAANAPGVGGIGGTNGSHAHPNTDVTGSASPFINGQTVTTGPESGHFHKFLAPIARSVHGTGDTYTIIDPGSSILEYGAWYGSYNTWGFGKPETGGPPSAGNDYSGVSGGGDNSYGNFRVGGGVTGGGSRKDTLYEVTTSGGSGHTHSVTLSGQNLSHTHAIGGNTKPNSGLAGQDSRPKHVGMIKIMKVRRTTGA